MLNLILTKGVPWSHGSSTTQLPSTIPRSLSYSESFFSFFVLNFLKSFFEPKWQHVVGSRISNTPKSSLFLKDKLVLPAGPFPPVESQKSDSPPHSVPARPHPVQAGRALCWGGWLHLQITHLISSPTGSSTTLLAISLVCYRVGWEFSKSSAGSFQLTDSFLSSSVLSHFTASSKEQSGCTLHTLEIPQLNI